MLAQRHSHDISNKSPRKDKKWSFGRLFRRRRKKESCAHSSSEEDKNGGINLKRESRSDFIPASNFTTRYIPLKGSWESLNRTNNSAPQVSSLVRRKKDVIKARAEARRDSTRCDDGSSDEDSQQSALRSDDSLAKYKDGLLSSRSRAARTQRYLKRRSRDEEIYEQLRANNSDIEYDKYYRNLQHLKPSLYYSNTSSRSSISGLSTIPPNHYRHKSNGYEPSMTHSYNGFDNAQTKYLPNHQRSLSCNGTICVNNNFSPEISVGKNFPTKCRDFRYPSNTQYNCQTGTSSNGYCYFTDKNPRSRKPITIQQTNELQKQKLDYQSPLMFTAKTCVRTTTFLPNGLTIQSDFNTYDDSDRLISPFRPNTPTDSPSIGNINGHETNHHKPSNFEDALDELEAIYNSLHLADENLLDRAEQREEEVAREQAIKKLNDLDLDQRKGLRNICNLKVDDMAYRKLRKDSHKIISGNRHDVSTGSYLLTSPIFNPIKDVQANGHEPNVTYDDVIYRSVKQSNDMLKVEDPQPLFGIPVGPIKSTSNSDYLHASPGHVDKRMSRRNIPDVVKDDLAYRNLRKDFNNEPVLPHSNISPEHYKSNYSRKMRPARPLSDNIGRWFVMDSQYQDLCDIADTLEDSKRALKETENQIKGKLFMSDGELTYRPFNRDSVVDRQSVVDDLLSSLAAQTCEANKCIDNELKKCDEKKKLKKALENSLSVGMTREKLNQPRIDSNLEHAKLCEKLLECVIESTELLATANIDSGPTEEVARVNIEPLFGGTVANVVFTPDDHSRFDVSPIEVYSDSDHDYVNFLSASDDTKIQTALNVTERCSSTELDFEVQGLLDVVSDEPSVSPFEKHKDELLAVFDEMRLPEEMQNTVDGVEGIYKNGGEKCASVQYIALPVIKGCAYISEIYLTLEGSDLKTKDVKSSSCIENRSDLEVLESEMVYPLELEENQCNSMQLLVKSTKDIRCNLDLENRSCNAYANNNEILSVNDNVFKCSQLDLRHTLEYPAIIAFACSCGISCFTQLLSNFDIVAALGLLFAVILLSIALDRQTV